MRRAVFNLGQTRRRVYQLLRGSAFRTQTSPRNRRVRVTFNMNDAVIFDIYPLRAAHSAVRADRLNYFVGLYRSEEHTSELQSRGHLVCRLLLEKKKRTAEQPLPFNRHERRST